MDLLDYDKGLCMVYLIEFIIDPYHKGSTDILSEVNLGGYYPFFYLLLDNETHNLKLVLKYGE
jgi:hypothetical protein